MLSVRVLGRRLLKQAKERVRVDSIQVSFTSHNGYLPSARGIATGSGDTDSGAFPAAGQRSRKDWRALADKQLRPPTKEQDSSNRATAEDQAELAQASSQEQPWSAADHEGDASNEAPAFTDTRGAQASTQHTDHFMEEEGVKRQAAASTSAPPAAAFEDPAFLQETSGGHTPEFRADSSSGVGPDPRQNSYNEDPFMRNERASRGIGDGAGPSQRVPRGRPKTGTGPARFPRKTIEGEPREVEYDDPFMRIERASRLPPQQPNAPEVVDDTRGQAEPDEPSPEPSGGGAKQGEMGQSAPSASQQQATAQSELTNDLMRNTQQELGEEARLAEAKAGELRNQVHKYESGQPSAASGKTPEHANIPQLKKQAAKATQKAKTQKKSAKRESSDIGQRISPVAAPQSPAQSASPQEASSSTASIQDVSDAQSATSAALQAAADEEAQLDKDALDRAAAASLGQQPAASSSTSGLSWSQQVHQKAIAEMTGGGVTPDPMTGYGELGYRAAEAGRERPVDAGGKPLPPSLMTPEQRQQMLFSSPRINPSRIFVPGQFYDPQDLVGADDSSTSMFGPLRRPQNRPAQMPSPAAGKAADFRNTYLLDAYLSESGKIHPRRQTRMSAKDQRALVRKLKLARQLALLPSTSNLASMQAQRPLAEVS
ncbi:hypothetical protein WJX74_007849 [Apatococcus lobatus]|uniref:Small ribosomal subunit protein bS18c n=2 Tax=Apatococcus TaxID=904362 RepID=A0AAW1S4A2_9CHLO